MKRLFMLVPLIAFETAKATSYDECVLAHIAGARKDEAVESIQIACYCVVKVAAAEGDCGSLKAGGFATIELASSRP